MSDLNIGSSNQQQTSAALLEQLVYIDTFMNNNSGGSTGDLTPNLDIDGQLSIDLAAFADDSFIFPDEDKPKNNHGKGHNHDDDNDDMDLDNLHHINNNNNNSNNGHHDHHQHHIKSEADDPLLSSNLASSTDSSPNYQQSHHHNPSQLVLASNFTNSNNTNNNNNNNNNSILDDINISKLPKFPVPPGAKSSLVSAGLSQNQIDLLSALIAQHQTRLGNPLPSGSGTNGSSSDFATHVRSQNFNSPVRQHNQLQPFNNDESIVGSSNNNNNGNGGLSFNDSPISMTSSSTTLQASPSLTIRTPTSEELLLKGEFGGMSAEVDKRRRNTAASARFRIKKKLKEKQMEHRIFSLNELIKEFEIKIQQLEMENKLLRNLIIEKGSQKSDNELKLLRERARQN